MKRGKSLLALLLAALLALGGLPAVLAQEPGNSPVPLTASAPEESSEAASVLAPEPEGSESAPEGSESAPEGSESAPEESESAPEGSESAPEGSEPAPEESESEPEGSEPVPEESESAPEGSESEPDMAVTEPEGDASQPEQDPGLSPQEGEDPTQSQSGEESEEENEEEEEDPSTDPNYYTPTVELLTGEENAYSNYKALRRLIKRADGVHPLTITVARKGRYYISYKEGSKSKGMRLRTMTTLDLNGATLIRTGNISNLIQVENLNQEQSVAGYTCAKDLTIRNGTLDGGEGEAASVGVNLVNLGHVDGLRMENLTLTHGQGTHLMELNGCRNVNITGCTFSGFEPWMEEYAVARPEAIQLDIAYNGAKTAWNGVYCQEGTPGMDMTVCRNVTITQCRFLDYPSGVGNHHALYDGPRSTGIKIINNRFENNRGYAYLGYAVWCYGFEDCEVSGNSILGKYAVGIRLSGCQAKVKDNQVGSAAQPFIGYPIYANVANCNVVGELTQRKPVYVTKTRIYRNKIYTSLSKKKEGAITVLGKCALTTITSNTICAPKACGIAVRSGSSVEKLNSNQVTKTGKSAVYLSGAKVTKLEHNTLSGSAGLELRSKSSVDKLRKNTITAKSGVGIAILKGCKVKRLTENHVKKATKGAVCISGSTVAALESNTLHSRSASGALQVGKGSKVTNLRKNSLKATKGAGINVTGGKVSAITGNKITSPGGDGIRMSGGSVVKVESNRVSKAKKDGILATSSAVVKRVCGNSVTGCKGTGIRILNLKLKPTVQRNYLKGNGKTMEIPALKIPAPTVENQ